MTAVAEAREKPDKLDSGRAVASLTLGLDYGMEFLLFALLLAQAGIQQFNLYQWVRPRTLQSNSIYLQSSSIPIFRTVQSLPWVRPSLQSSSMASSELLP